MRLALLFVLAFAGTVAGQTAGDCDLTDARTFHVTHSATTSARERKKIDKALRRSGDLKQIDRAEQADIQIDFTEAAWLNVWRNKNGQRESVGRWSLLAGSATATFPGSIRTTVVRTGPVTTANTIATSPRTMTIDVSPEINTAGEFLFQLKVRRKSCRAARLS